LKTLLAPLNDGKSRWRYMARELLAYRALRDDQADAAGKEFAALAADKDAPPSLRQRAEAMSTLVKSSGGKDYGKVPEPQKTDAAAQGTKTP
jgi:hypothetical protein